MAAGRPTRRMVLGAVMGAGVAAFAGLAVLRNSRREQAPNVVLILVDDLGYNDLGCYRTTGEGHEVPPLATPRLDQLASEGMRFTDFHVAAAVCTPSRAALLTGCYPPRVGFRDKLAGPGVLVPASTEGLHPDEETLADLLRARGHQTALIGKWHLGHRKTLLPTRQGFDDFFGVPYSNNQHPLPLLRNEKFLRKLPDNPILTGQFSAAAQTFLEEADPERPFFLYLALTAPHWPWGVPPEWRGRSARGPYGDVVEQLDWTVGQVLDTLDRRGMRQNTLVLFLSDNGPDLEPGRQAGDAWPLRGGKASVWEGAWKVPFLARWPGRIPGGSVCDTLCSAMDIVPTVVGFTGARPPVRAIDGKDIGPLLTAAPGAHSPHEVLGYYARGRLEAVRSGRFKRVFAVPRRKPPVAEALYDLEADPGETTDVSADHPAEVARLDQLADGLRAEVGDVLTGTTGTGERPLGAG